MTTANFSLLFGNFCTIPLSNFSEIDKQMYATYVAEFPAAWKKWNSPAAGNSPPSLPLEKTYLLFSELKTVYLS